MRSAVKTCLSLAQRQPANANMNLAELEKNINNKWLWYSNICIKNILI